VTLVAPAPPPLYSAVPAARRFLSVVSDVKTGHDTQPSRRIEVICAQSQRLLRPLFCPSRGAGRVGGSSGQLTLLYLSVAVPHPSFLLRRLLSNSGDDCAQAGSQRRDRFSFAGPPPCRVPSQLFDRNRARRPSVRSPV
jgi:hypothetical protein